MKRIAKLNLAVISTLIFIIAELAFVIAVLITNDDKISSVEDPLQNGYVKFNEATYQKVLKAKFGVKIQDSEKSAEENIVTPADPAAPTN